MASDQIARRGVTQELVARGVAAYRPSSRTGIVSDPEVTSIPLAHEFNHLSWFSDYHKVFLRKLPRADKTADEQS